MHEIRSTCQAQHLTNTKTLCFDENAENRQGASRFETMSTMDSLESNSGETDQSTATSFSLTPLNVERLSTSSSSPNPIQHVLREVGHHLKKWQRAFLKMALSRRLHMLQQIKLEAERSKSPEAKMKRKKSRECMGDMGAALFHPLNYDDEQHVDEQCGDDDDHGTRLTTASVDELAAADMHNVQVMPTHDDIPFLLSISSMNMIVNSLPWTLHSRKWVRLYSCLKDGDSFPAFLYHVRGHTRTLLVLETSKGEVFGGFADAPWEQGTLAMDGCFFGSGQSFLYSVMEDGTVQTHRWTALNDYSQFCRTGSVGMGGGGGHGAFGLLLHDQFTRGSSGPCETFGTKASLCSQEHFDIVEFQVFGFLQSH